MTERQAESQVFTCSECERKRTMDRLTFVDNDGYLYCDGCSEDDEPDGNFDDADKIY